MVSGRLSVDACARLSHVPSSRQSFGTEIYEGSSIVSTAKRPDDLQLVSNRFQRLDVLSRLPADLVQRLQLHLPTGGLL